MSKELTEKVNKIGKAVEKLNNTPEKRKKFWQEWNSLTVYCTLAAQQNYQEQMRSLRRMETTYVDG